MFKDLLRKIELLESSKLARSALPAEMEAEIEEEAPMPSIVSIVNDEDIGYDTQELLVQESELLEGVPLPGRTKNEAERKHEWLKLPRPARAAMRRLHTQFGNCLEEPFDWHITRSRGTRRMLGGCLTLPLYGV